MTQTSPFVTRTGGIICTIGTTLPDNTNLLYNMYLNKEIGEDKRFFFTWEEVRDLKKIRNPAEAARYEKRVLGEIKRYGIQSDYIQTQYYVSFDIKGSRFTTLDSLEPLMTGDYGLTQDEIIEASNNMNKYIFASLDTAVMNDYSVMIIGISEEIDNSIRNIVKKVIIFNPNKEQISPEDLMQKVANICHSYRVDSIIIDTTANQIDRAFYLQKELVNKQINTQIIPYSYANQNKRMMMGYLEDSIFNQNLILPKKEYRKRSEYNELIEELLYLKKEVSPSGVLTYKAPETSNCYDDAVMALGQFNYCYKVMMKYISDNKKIKLGGSAVYNLSYNKFLQFDSALERAGYYNFY